MDKDRLEKYAVLGESFATVAPLLAASMQESARIGDDLMKSNVQSAFRDGFEAGVREGRKRALMDVRDQLGVWQEHEPVFLQAGYYLGCMIQQRQYPYNLLTLDEVRED